MLESVLSFEKTALDGLLKLFVENLETQQRVYFHVRQD